MTDQRHWVLDPAGHREHMSATGPKVGDTYLGIEVIAVLDDMLEPDEWICDLCNGLILTRWGDEPFPVPVTGSDALCSNCRDLVESQEGRWPAQSCMCPPCRRQLIAWIDHIDHAYSVRATRRATAPLN